MKIKKNALIFASVLSMLFLLLLSSCAPGQKAVFGKAIGDICTTVLDCDEGENCVNSVCVASFTLTSEGISAEGIISSDYVCSEITGGGGQSPQLTFSNIPTGTQSIIVGILDEDALVEGGAYNGGTIIPVWQRPGYGDSQSIHWWFYVPVPEGATTFSIDAATFPAGFIVGQNSIEYNAADIDSAHRYAPLCPPDGEAHEYWITAVAYGDTIPAGTILGRYNDFGIIGQAMLDSTIDAAYVSGYYPCNPLEDSSCVAGVRYEAGRLCNEDMDCWSGYCKDRLDGIGQCYAACGDGYGEGFEACDDGNRNDDDGCSADCQLEEGFLCQVETNGCRAVACSGSDPTCEILQCSLDFHSYLGCTTQASCEALNVGQLEPLTIWCNDKCRPRQVVPYVVDANAMIVGSTPSIAEECAGITSQSTCDNDILDGDEINVDCGGSCQACPMREGCGDGQVDMGETCSTCPADVECPTGEICRADTCMVPRCGNGWIDVNEQCDDDNVNQNTCLTIAGGFTGGTLSCVLAGQPNECRYDVSRCTAPALLCGNDQVDAGEACDGTLGVGSCLAGTSGTPTCAPNCQSIDTSACVPDCTEEDWTTTAWGPCTIIDGTATCGTGTGEQSRTVTQNRACGGGFARPLASQSCILSACLQATACGNGLQDGAEQCDDNNANSNDGCSATCEIETGFECLTAGQACRTICGNSMVNAEETCSSCPADVQCAAEQACQEGLCITDAPTITLTGQDSPRIDIIPSGTSILVQANDVTILEAPATTNLGSVTVTTGMAQAGGSVVVVAGLEGVDHFVYVPNILDTGVFTCPAGTTIAETVPSCPGVIMHSYADCSAGIGGCSIVGSQYKVSSTGSSHGENPASDSYCDSDGDCAADQDCIDAVCTASGSLCGNGAIDGEEQCDTLNIGASTCLTISGGFTGGTLSCNSACQFDTTLCTSVRVLGKQCSSDSQCPTMDCINLKCTDVINQIGEVLQNTQQNKLQKFAALANILRSYFSQSS